MILKQKFLIKNFFELGKQIPSKFPHQFHFARFQIFDFIITRRLISLSHYESINLIGKQ